MAENNISTTTEAKTKRPEDINAFFDESSTSGFKFKDLIFLVLRNLHWFIICALIGGAIAYYKVRGKDLFQLRLLAD